MTTRSITYSRGKLAAHTGVKSETIRYYENCGLLPTPARTAGGHRIYNEGHSRQLVFIRRCRELGFTLAEVKGLLDLAEPGKQNCEQVRDLTSTHLTDIRHKIRDLKKMEKTLKIMVQDCTVNTAPHCPIISALSS